MRTCECLCLVCGKESGNLHDATTTTSTADLQNVVVSINLTVYYYARGFKSISDGYRVKSMFFCGPFPQEVYCTEVYCSGKHWIWTADPSTFFFSSCILHVFLWLFFLFHLNVHEEDEKGKSDNKKTCKHRPPCPLCPVCQSFMISACNHDLLEKKSKKIHVPSFPLSSSLIFHHLRATTPSSSPSSVKSRVATSWHFFRGGGGGGGLRSNN